MSLRDWIYIIQLNEYDHVLYAPLHKTAMRVTPSAAFGLKRILDEPNFSLADSDYYEFLQDSGLLNLPVQNPFKKSNKIFLSITNKCNLRCIYCYANTGIDNSTMKFATAKIAIDHLIRQTQNSGEKAFAITFHGGGEALVEFKLLTRIVEYINEVANVHKLNPHLGLVTNGTLITRDIAHWLSDNFSHMTISLDGLKEIQDKQRPTAKLSGSFENVHDGVRFLKDEEVNYSIRSTVTGYNVSKMAEFVEQAKTMFYLDKGEISFEPVSFSGRAKSATDLIPTNKDLFFENYIHARQIGREIGVRVTSSMDTFGSVRINYCGATCADLECYTPDNRLSACTRVTKKTDEGASLFFYGKIHKHDVMIDPIPKMKIKALGNGHKTECNTCFAKWNCQGGCLITRLYDKENFDITCCITRALLLNDLTIALFPNPQNT